MNQMSNELVDKKIKILEGLRDKRISLADSFRKHQIRNSNELFNYECTLAIKEFEVFD